MKKKYEKPAIVFERFELSQHIADCTWNMNQTEDGSCTGNASDKGFDGVLFINGHNCDYGTNEIEEYCYTVATSSKVTFIS